MADNKNHSMTIRRERIAALKRVFNGEDGRKALALIAEYALEGKQAYVPGMPPEHTIFRSGCQQVIIDLRQLLDTDLAQMDREIEAFNQTPKEEIDL